MGENDLEKLKTEFHDKWEYLTKGIAYLYEHFNSIGDYQKLVNNSKEEDFFSKLKNRYPSDNETERTMDIIKRFNFNKREEETELYLESDVLFLACFFESFKSVD